MYSVKKFLFQAGIISFSFSFSSCLFAAQPINLREQPINILEKIQLTNTSSKIYSPFLTPKFKEISRGMDSNETTHIRMQQYVGDAPVLGGDFVIHIPKTEEQFANKSLAQLKLTKFTRMNGMLYQNLESDLQSFPVSQFSKAQQDNALTHAFKFYQINNKKMSDVENKLVVYIDKKQKAHWAYMINFIARTVQGGVENPSYILDATTFEPYQHWNGMRGIEEVKAGGPGGNYLTKEVDYDFGNLAGFKILREPLNNTCYMRNDRIVLRDMVNNLDVVEFSCPTQTLNHKNLYWHDLDYTNGAYSPTNDAFFAATVAINMYQDWYKTIVWADEKGNPKPIIFWMHHQRPDSWSSDGWKQYSACIGNRYIVIGDGDEDAYLPFSTLDLVVHEISHGFTYAHAHLADWPDQSQAAAIDESFSDMAAKTAESYLYGPDYQNWKIGRVLKHRGDGWLRFMDHPSEDCKWKANTYSECSIENINQFNKITGPHFASGIFNKAFYLMTTASGSTRAAFDVMMQANQHYWTSTTTFCEAAKNVVKAASDVHFDPKIATDAFLQVGIDIKTCK